MSPLKISVKSTAIHPFSFSFLSAVFLLLVLLPCPKFLSILAEPSSASPLIHRCPWGLLLPPEFSYSVPSEVFLKWVLGDKNHDRFLDSCLRELPVYWAPSRFRFFHLSFPPDLSLPVPFTLSFPLTPLKVCTGDKRVESVQQILCKPSHWRESFAPGIQWRTVVELKARVTLLGFKSCMTC